MVEEYDNAENGVIEQIVDGRFKYKIKKLCWKCSMQFMTAFVFRTR